MTQIRRSTIVLVALLITAFSLGAPAIAQRAPTRSATVVAVYLNVAVVDLAVGQTLVVTATPLDALNDPVPDVSVQFNKASRSCIKIESLGNNQARVTGIQSDPKFGGTVNIEAHVGNVYGGAIVHCIR